MLEDYSIIYKNTRCLPRDNSLRNENKAEDAGIGKTSRRVGRDQCESRTANF